MDAPRSDVPSDVPASSDVCIQTITVHPDTGHLWIFGVDRGGTPAAVRVLEFQPSFLLRAPEGTPDDVALLAEEELASCNALGYSGAEPLVTSIHSTCATPFIGFTNGRKDRLWQVVCASPRAFHRVVQQYRDSLTTMFHEDIRVENQLLQRTDLSYQSWITIPVASWRSAPRDTHCAVEASVRVSHIRRSAQQDQIPSVRKCYIHVQAVSRDGVHEGCHAYRPDASRPYDRVVAVAMCDARSSDPGTVHTAVLALGPTPPGAADATGFDSELELLEAVRARLLRLDPDDLFYYPDNVPTLDYLADRYAALGGTGCLDLGRFRRVRPRHGARWRPDLVHGTRSLLSIVDIVKRSASSTVEAYDLGTVSCDPSLRKQPESAETCRVLTTAHANASVGAGWAGQEATLHAARLAATLLRALDEDGGMRLEFSNISRVSDTSITSAVSRGEQARVYNKLVRFCKESGFYVNREATSTEPLRFPVHGRPPTFLDPREHPVNAEIRAASTREAEHLRRRADPGAKRGRSASGPDPFVSAAAEADEEEGPGAEGGNVLHPSPGFWGSRRIAVFDFASLYPSIMRSYNISYETLVFDARYLDLPGVDYLFVPINQDETVAIADVPGVIPRLLQTLVDARNDIKRRMKGAVDPFRRAMYDKEQNSMKVLCNATYGFCGADGRGALLAVKAVMYVVTALGRYLQKRSSEYLAATYGIPTVYGDTDSVFVLVDPLEEGVGVAEAAARAGRAYGMDGYEGLGTFGWDSVAAFYQRTRSLDVTRLDGAHQVNAYMYLVYQKLCAEVTALFRSHIVLEMENMCDNVWMGWVKKHYCYRMWDPGHPGKVQKIKITGMPVKKREYAPWVREVLMHLTELLLGGRAADVGAYLSDQVARLAAGRVPIDRLRISRSYKGMDKYKHTRQPQIQVAQKIEERCRYTVPPNSRVFFVVVAGPGLMYARAETPEYAAEHSLPLDYVYYLRQQLYRPVRNLLTYHPGVCSVEAIFGDACRGVELVQQGVRDVGACAAPNKYRRLSLGEVVGRRRVPRARPTPTPGVRLDPFAAVSQGPR
jgi:DNA polymerase elongation subunit (family B)